MFVAYLPTQNVRLAEHVGNLERPSPQADNTD